MNTNTQLAAFGTQFRRALLSGLVLVALLLTSSTDALAQNWKSAADARFALKTEIVALTDAAVQLQETDQVEYNRDQMRIRFYNLIYNQIRSGQTVSKSLDAAYDDLFKAASLTDSAVTSDRQGNITARDYRSDAEALLTN